ncbi:MAG: phage major capsid protein [Oscillospiraceae bacterium]|nr:phage major capsid protein [Oscillospiraceae bacterium]
MPSYITRENLAGLIPEPVTREIFQGVTEQSAVLRYGRKLPNMTAKTQSINVLDMLPLAYWVDGDTGFKQTSHMAWDKKKLYAEELAVIIPIPEAVLEDSNYDIWGEVRPRIVEAMGQRIDEAILFGTNKPATWRESILETATDAGTVVTATADLYQDIMGVDGVIARAEESGYMPTGVMSAVSMRARLRGLVDQNKQPIFVSGMQGKTPYMLDGMEMSFPMNGAWDDTKALMIVGDFHQLVYSIRQDVTYKILTEATIVDPATRDVVYSLAQQDMVALRAVMRLGWEIPNPISAYRSRLDDYCPFAVYVPADGEGG